MRSPRLLRSVLASLALTAALVVPATTSASAQTGHDLSAVPPVMSSPTRVELSSSTPTDELPAWTILCAGKYYRIDLREDEDAVITMAGSQPLTYPIWIVGGRNVRVVGLEMALETQPGCAVGELHNSGSNARNIHLESQGNGDPARELRHVLCGRRGHRHDWHEADCFVVRNPADLTQARARNERHIVLQNTRCVGVEGLGQSSIGDGVHGDLIQNQDFDVVNSMTIENVTMRTSMEGIVLHNDGATAGARSLTIRRFDYAADHRYDDDDSFEQFGVAYSASADQWHLEDVYLDDPKGNNYGFVNRERYGSLVSPYVSIHSGVHDGLPAGGAFAPAASVGLGFVSPHDGLAGNSIARSAGAVKRLYQASFGRSPEPAGSIYWQEVAASGVSLTAIAATFQASPEWEKRYGSAASAAQIVDNLYANVLGRPADDEGRQYWLRLLANGQITNAEILLQFSESPENKARTGSS